MARNPFDDIERKFDDIWRTMRSPGSGSLGVGGAPDMEIIEEHDSLILCCDVPGAEREDIRVDVSPQRVVISALTRGSFDGWRGIFQRERPYQSFERAITLPVEVRPDAAEAHYNNGVLEVVLPKRISGGVGVYRVPAE